MTGRKGTDKTFTLIKSEVTPVGDVINLGEIDVTKAHCFAGTQFFADAEGKTEASPSTGSILITIQTLNNAPRFENASSHTINAADPSTVSWSANTRRVKATPTLVDIATHYRLVVTCNET